MRIPWTEPLGVKLRQKVFAKKVLSMSEVYGGYKEGGFHSDVRN
jgi:hypothetical protein